MYEKRLSTINLTRNRFVMIMKRIIVQHILSHSIRTQIIYLCIHNLNQVKHPKYATEYRNIIESRFLGNVLSGL